MGAVKLTWPQGGWSGRRRRSVQTVSNLPAGTSYFTADCLTLPTWANYTDYSCASWMAKLCNYKEPVCMIMCHTEKKKNMEILGLPSNEPIKSFSSMCGTLLKTSTWRHFSYTQAFSLHVHDPAEGSGTTPLKSLFWEQGQRLLCWSSFERV